MKGVCWIGVLLSLSVVVVHAGGSWDLISYGGAAPKARAFHTTVLDHRNRVFLFGGNTAQFELDLQNDLYCYDIESKQWEALNPWGTPPLSRYRHTAVYDEESKNMVVFGGAHSASPIDPPVLLNDVSYYHVDKNQWTSNIETSGTIPQPRFYHVAVAKDGVMTVFGGSGQSQLFNDVYKYDIGSKRWVKPPVTGSIPSPRSHASAVVFDNKMVIFGGFRWHGPEGYLNDVYTLDLDTNHWVHVAVDGSPPTRRVGHSAVMLGSLMYVFAGYEIEGLFVNNLYALDLNTGVWNDVVEEDAPRPRYSHTAVAPHGSADDQFLVFYGYSDELVLPAIYFDDVWHRQQ